MKNRGVMIPDGVGVVALALLCVVVFVCIQGQGWPRICAESTRMSKVFRVRWKGQRGRSE